MSGADAFWLAAYALAGPNGDVVAPQEQLRTTAAPSGRLVNLSSLHLEGAFLGDAYLAGAWLWQAHLEGAALNNASLRALHMTGADLDRVRTWKPFLAYRPPAEQARVWEAYHRAADGTSPAGARVGAGLGIGLYVSRTLIERHQGQVGVESPLPQGAALWFTVPLALEPQQL